MHVRIGCCGFPRARSVYYRTFPLVEVQQTFYHPPQEATLQRWRQEAPDGWEPRGPWPAERVQRLCRELDLIHVTDPFRGPSFHGTPTYWRLHGRTGYRYRYTETDLIQLIAWVQALKGEVYCLFNNRFMWEDAQRFKQKLDDLYGRPAP